MVSSRVVEGIASLPYLSGNRSSSNSLAAVDSVSGAGESQACARATRRLRVLLGVSLGIYVPGFGVAYLLPVLLAWLDS